MATIENLDENGYIVEGAGRKIVSPNEDLYLFMKKRPASVVVTVTGVSSYMISASQSSTNFVKNDDATFIDADDVDYESSDDYLIQMGSAIKISNKSFSIDDTIVDWRI